MKEIKFPEFKTWYICWNTNRANIMVHGFVKPNQTMSTYWDVLDTYTSEEEWLQVLANNGITMEDDDVTMEDEDNG